mmetsp:Transcript_8238/g.16424  ORF Transcript_8238/g.16424 Transcript_8238/m.16424 type:complete len:372 (-) Transcript_8238:761-1876(-)
MATLNLVGGGLTALLGSLGKTLENLAGASHVNAGISDGDTVLEGSGVGDTNVHLLVALTDVGLDHETGDALAASGDLLSEISGNLGLVLVVLVGVTVAAVNHDANLHAVLLHDGGSGINVLLLEVGASAASTKNDVAAKVALGVNDGSNTLFGHREERVRVLGGLACINGDLNISTGGVLETHGAGKSRGKFAVHLRLGGTCSDGTPRNKVREELGGDSVQELNTAGESELVDLEEELAANAETLVDLEGSIKIRVVDETLPADGGAGLLEVHAHDHKNLILKLSGKLGKLLGVLAASLNIVDGARADDDDHAVVLTVHDAVHGLTAGTNVVDDLITGVNVLNEARGGDEGAEEVNAHVINLLGAGLRKPV